MKYAKLTQWMFILAIVLLVAGCLTVTASPTPTAVQPTSTPIPPTAMPTLTPLPPTPVPPTSTPTPLPKPRITGTLNNSDGLIADGLIYLHAFQGETCEKLAQKKGSFSDEEDEQFDKCMANLTLVNSDENGQYEFLDAAPGWYKINFTWVLPEKPNVSSPVDYRDNFLIVYFETETEPKQYTAEARGKVFYYSGEEDLIIDFDFNKK